MGWLLKIALLGMALYVAWKTVTRWKGLYDRFVGRAPDPARQPARSAPNQSQPSPAADRAKVIDASVLCSVCNAYLTSGATKCGRPDCPLP